MLNMARAKLDNVGNLWTLIFHLLKIRILNFVKTWWSTLQSSSQYLIVSFLRFQLLDIREVYSSLDILLKRDISGVEPT